MLYCASYLSLVLSTDYLYAYRAVVVNDYHFDTALHVTFYGRGRLCCNV